MILIISYTFLFGQTAYRPLAELRGGIDGANIGLLYPRFADDIYSEAFRGSDIICRVVQTNRSVAAGDGHYRWVVRNLANLLSKR